MITFTITADSSVSPEVICEGIADVDKWTSFVGHGPLPGIRKVIKTSSTGALVGSVFHVENTDGSKHKETIQALDPGIRIIMRMEDFSPPLCHLATHFIERWDFVPAPPMYRIARTFELYPKNRFALIPLWLISHFLKKAVEKHTHQIADPRPLT